MIVGIGVDVVALARFERQIERTPALVERLFCPDERVRHPRSLAARFAAKEAVAKALGAPGNLRWHDCEVVTSPSGAPSIRASGTVAERATALGVSRWHVSLTHDGDSAIAMVVAEGDGL
ncbi:holo-ACP synthase [Galactobacter caseinivorans]|uniref:Holo-[acyl-carrier-protein] synthase n=1 Tax=Galactobacter caseinivorans TaxID=2676123 RepID=A0A496PLU2_9MICC|nr:holo-ACP synthase [Galactobacter caseinivorans]RKW71500.1 holo-ACP synthase [Galactobacter caseinivorans]